MFRSEIKKALAAAEARIAEVERLIQAAEARIAELEGRVTDLAQPVAAPIKPVAAKKAAPAKAAPVRKRK